MKRDMSERQFLDALARHGMKVVGGNSIGCFNLGIPGCNRWDKPPEGLKRRAKLAYLIASRESALAKAEAERATALDPDSIEMFMSLPRGEDR